jgi:hypothetical protein
MVDLFFWTGPVHDSGPYSDVHSTTELAPGVRVRVTRFAKVRLLLAALVAMLVVGAALAVAVAAEGGVDVATILLTVLLGVVSFSVLAVVLLFDSRRRHQLARVLRSFVTSDRPLVRYRRADDDGEPRDEQLAEMRRRLDYALEGLWRAVGSGPAAVGASSGAAMTEDGFGSSRLALESAVREMRPYATTPLPEHVAADLPSGPAPSQPRLPVSPRVAQGAPLVRVSVTRQRQCRGTASARIRLTGLRAEDVTSVRRAALARWLIRAVVVLIVPAILTYQMSSRTSWIGGVWDGVATRSGFLVAFAFAAVGSVWTFVVTRREHGLHEGPRTSGESHAVRSLLATEQLAVRLAVGVAPSEAWRVVAQTNHFPPGSAIPAVAVGEALALVEQLRRASRRRHLLPARRRIAAIVRPLLTCVLPAAVIILLL